MPKALLAANFVLPVAIAAGVLVLAVFIYGIVRKFTRVSWLSWQVLIVFAVTFLLDLVPVPAGGWSGWEGVFFCAGGFGR